ncbi:TonB-dependent receptor [Novosphingobium beihaiensis]|uniref:TonB-dependent receptor n=1 Tax=Novosphingobium beihaiensis TaxID=2930389 RepID=A0ABT0BW53_9SPHN|nr:TonB-dependent receptor [Novosphingobium beihaiensis]MCJ2189108.1 TonB-dependent receptor [Novosphingobium beihaiensis]
MKNAIFGISASVLALCVPQIVRAQDTGAKPGGGEATVNEIIVTGQKRSENLQEIPAAVSVLGGDSLVNVGVEQMDDLQNAVPGLSISSAGLTQAVNIRGIGLASTSPNAANGVATYFDGVFQPPIVSTNSFYDIGSVEVFRGPQGTFVGSNSTGGAIFITSRNPELGHYGGNFTLETGNYNRVGANGALNVPLGDTIAVRAAGIYRNRDSFYTMEDPSLGNPGKLHEYAGRLGVYFEPSSNFSALFKAEVARKDTGGYAYRPILGTRYEDYRTDDIYKLNYNSPTRNREKAEQYTAKLDYTTDGGVIFRSISGYQNKRISNFYDVDGSDGAGFTQDQFVRERVWTQEVNVISPDEGMLRWIFGGYYQRNKVLVDISNDPASAVHVDIDIRNRKITTGLFGQVSFHANDQFWVDLGARYSTYKVRGEGAVSLVTPGGTRYLADPGGHEKDHKLTGKLALNWQPSPDHLFYGFVAKGYKSGGYSSPTTTFKPETIVDYELGWKGTFANGAITTQLGGFYYDYNNFQLDALSPLTGRTTLINLTNATVKGLEAQVQARAGGLHLTGSVAYTDSKLGGTDFVDARAVAYAYPGSSSVPPCAAGETPSSTPPYNCIAYGDFMNTTAGGPNLFSPKWTWNLSADYEIPVGEKLTITPRASLSHVGSRYTYIAYDPVRDRLAAYDLVNASIDFAFDRLTFSVWGTNLAKEKYATGQINNTSEFYGAPREYGIRMKVEL